MNKFNSLLISALSLTVIFAGCKKKDDEVKPEDPTPSFRTKINSALLTSTTAYNNELFYDANGDSTVDRLEGQQRLLMFKALDAYAKTGTSATVSSATLDNMFANMNYPFTGVYASLNTAEVDVKDATATTSIKAFAIRKQIEGFFDSLANASAFYTVDADNGVAGIAKNTTGSKYLVDAKGIEWAQVISKSLIGSFQLDYIGNNLLGTGLAADNSGLVPGENYTALEHNWDVAYGILTLKARYAQDASTDHVNGKSNESFIGSYLWEYNTTGYLKIHEAFLLGRAAIINNDMATVKAQAKLIRNEMEIAVANAAIGYMEKWKAAGNDVGAATHALGEGLGFLFALRFCELHGSDAAFAEPIFNEVVAKGNWGLSNPKVNDVEAAIKAKFNIQ